MKKRLLGLFLAVAMLLGMMVFPVSAEETLPEKAYNPTPLPFLQGIGFEELLLLGLIVLLAHNEKGNDIVLWLALLLFSG